MDTSAESYQFFNKLKAPPTHCAAIVTIPLAWLFRHRAGPLHKYRLFQCDFSATANLADNQPSGIAPAKRKAPAHRGEQLPLARQATTHNLFHQGPRMTTPQAFICDAIRTPFGRYGGALASVRTDDLGAIPLKALMARNPNVDWAAVTDVLYGCANQAGEDNRNIARMALLLAGLPTDVPGATLNRLCGSGLDAVGTAARAIKAGEAGLMIAGGVESMSRAPFVMPKMEAAYGRNNAVYDSTIGWRFVNQKMQEQYGIDSMPETAENVATDYKIAR